MPPQIVSCASCGTQFDIAGVPPGMQAGCPACRAPYGAPPGAAAATPLPAAVAVPIPASSPDDLLLHPSEKPLFWTCVTFGIVVYLLVAAATYFTYGVFLVYPLAAFLFFLVMHGLFIGSLRGNGIRVSATQFPEVDRMAREIAGQMGLIPVPAVYVLESGGILNAFATRFLGRDFVAIYSEILRLAYEQGEAAVAFVVAHELAHVKRGHLKRRWLLLPSRLLPFLGKAYSRACEYTCDRYGVKHRPEGAVPGLLALAAGGSLYRKVNVQEYQNQPATERGFWIWLAEKLSTHPNLPKRIAAAVHLGAVPPTAVPPTAAA
ncbi:MAG: M48 family metallopeptidase [Planctomycetes bacterium]|nr:M48 family metallopeptidase [Planctomycetota bacterium]